MWSRGLKGRVHLLRMARAAAKMRQLMLPYLRKGMSVEEAEACVGREVAAIKAATGGASPEVREQIADAIADASEGGPAGPDAAGGYTTFIPTLLLAVCGILAGCRYQWRMDVWEETRGLQIDVKGGDDEEACRSRSLLLSRVSVSAPLGRWRVHATQGDAADKEDVRGDDAPQQEGTRVTPRVGASTMGVDAREGS